MNATKFVVLLLIGVLCAKIGARKLEEVSKDSKLSISGAEATTKDVEDNLSVNISDYAYGSGSGSVYVSSGPTSANSYGSGYGSTGGAVSADGPDASASMGSGASGSGSANAAAGPASATGSSYGSGGGSTSGTGNTGSA